MRTLIDLPPCNNTTSSGFVLFVDGPLSTVIIVAGVLGNAYCLRVLFASSINTKMLVSLTALAVWDMLLLVAALFHHSIWASSAWLSIRRAPWDQYMVALAAVVECAHLTSTWMLLEVSAHRCHALSKPFLFAVTHSAKNRRQSYLKIVGGLVRRPLFITILACILTVPCSFEYELKQCNNNGHQYYKREETSLSQNPFYFVLYRTACLAIFKTFGPFAYMSYLTVNMLNSMRQSMNSRATILHQQGQGHLFESDKDKTKSLQAISNLLLWKFVVLRCFPTAVAVARALLATKHASQVTHVAEMMLLLNSATNCFIFVVIKSAFESRRLRRIRERHREMVARHAAQVLCIGKALAGDNLLHLTEEQNDNDNDRQPMTDGSSDRSTEPLGNLAFSTR